MRSNYWVLFIGIALVAGVIVLMMTCKAKLNSKPMNMSPTSPSEKMTRAILREANAAIINSFGFSEYSVRLRQTSERVITTEVLGVQVAKERPKVDIKSSPVVEDHIFSDTRGEIEIRILMNSGLLTDAKITAPEDGVAAAREWARLIKSRLPKVQITINGKAND